MSVHTLISRGMIEKAIDNMDGPFYCGIRVGQSGSMSLEDIALVKPISVLDGLGQKACVVVDPSMLVIQGMDHFVAEQKASDVASQVREILKRANPHSQATVVERKMWRSELLDYACLFSKIPWSYVKNRASSTAEAFEMFLSVERRSWMHEYMGFRTEICMPDESPLDMGKIGIKGHGFVIMKPIVGTVTPGCIFLSPSHTPIMQFYQYWMNLDDKVSCQMLPWLTDLPPQEIKEIEEAYSKNPQQRYPQKILANYMTRFVHGDEMADRGTAYSNLLFGGSEIKSLDESTLSWVAKLLPHEALASPLPMPLSKLLCKIGFCCSGAEAKRIISQGGISVNDIPFEEDNMVSKDHLAFGRYAFVLRGKKTYRVAIFEGA